MSNKDIHKTLSDILDGKSNEHKQNINSVSDTLKSILSDSDNNLISTLNEGGLIGLDHFTLNENSTED